MNIVNKRWRHFSRFAEDLKIKSDDLATMVADAKIGEPLAHGKLHLIVQKKTHDKYGTLYTLSLTDEDGNVKRRSPVYINKPNYRRLVIDAVTALMLIGVAVSSVAIVIAVVTDFGSVAVIQESCKIASLEVIETAPGLGFMRIVVQNDADRDATLKIYDPGAQVKFFDKTVTPPTPTLNEYDHGNLPARDTVEIGERLEGSNVKRGESILLQAELNYGGSSTPELSCTAEARIR